MYITHTSTYNSKKNIILLIEHKNDKNKHLQLQRSSQWMIIFINNLQKEWNYHVAQTKDQIARKNSFELALERITPHTTQDFEKLKKNMLKNYLKNT